SAPSSAWAASSSFCSPKAGAAIWKPTGSRAASAPPSSGAASPAGSAIAGIPARLIGTVKKSFMYIANGSSVFAPSPKATEGEVGGRLGRGDHVVGGDAVLGVREADLDDLAAELLDLGDRRLEDGADTGVERRLAELARDAELQAGEILATGQLDPTLDPDR